MSGEIAILLARWRHWRATTGVRAGIWLGYHLPMWLKYWCMNDLVAKATTGGYDATAVPELTAMTVLKRTGRTLGWHGFGEDA